MKKDHRSHYVFGAALAAVAVGGLPGLVDRASAATAADFSFETSAVALNTLNVTAASYGPLVAESGLGTASGSHANTATVYSSPAGNGSARSFSSNHWAVGDYYEFDVPTTGLSNIMLSFDQTSSSTGPKAFTLQYSTDGLNFSSFANYTDVTSFTVTSTNTAGSTTISSFSSSVSYSQYNMAFDLSSISALNNDPLAMFRLVDNDSTATSTAGTDRVDNVVVSGSAVPEPASVSLLTAAAALAMRRRR